MNLVWNGYIQSSVQKRYNTVECFCCIVAPTLFLLLFMFLITLERLYSVYISNTAIILTLWGNATLSQQGSSLARQERLREMCGQLGIPRPTLFQCFGSGSGFNEVCGSGSRMAKMTHKNRNNLEISCFEVLYVLFWGLKAASVAWPSFMEA